GECRVLKIVSDSNLHAATGIQCQLVDGSLEIIKSDLTVDASGNGSLTLDFLKSIGRRPPEETRIRLTIRYASAFFERFPLWNDYKIVFTLPGAPENRRSGIILPTENNSHHVLLAGRVKEIPPTGADEFLSYARELPTPTIYTSIKNAKRLTDITPFSFPGSRWRHFAQVSDFPRGLLPIGDAICRFNPVYAQGMSVASQQANVLFHLLQTSDGDPLAMLAPTFLTKAEALIADPWAMSAIPDFIYPETIGQRPPDLEDRLNFQRADMASSALLARPIKQSIQDLVIRTAFTAVGKKTGRPVNDRVCSLQRAKDDHATGEFQPRVCRRSAARCASG